MTYFVHITLLNCWLTPHYIVYSMLFLFQVFAFMLLFLETETEYGSERVRIYGSSEGSVDLHV